MTENSTTIVIFGITGDLAQKKIIPALFDMFSSGRISKDTRIVGFSRREMDDLEIRRYVSSLFPDDWDGKNFLEIISYVSGQFDDLESYRRLSEHLLKLDDDRKSCSNKLLYLSVPPTLYEMIARHIADSGLSIPCGGKDGFTRILIEKPFGKDLSTARHLDELLGLLFKEEQIFRIDHYVAKKSLSDLMNKHRKDNSFKSKWNNKFITKVEINLFEKGIVGNRGAFYDDVGTFRDVGQNHMLQILSLVAMKLPDNFDARNIQKARSDVLKKLIIPNKDEILKMHRGQYDGYLGENGVKENSKTETFFSMVTFIDTNDFKSVPFVLSSGKALNKNVTEIVIYFKDWPKFVFDVPAEDSQKAYEKILLDCILGDQTIFTSTEEILAEWSYVTPIVEVWKNTTPFIYKIGSHPEDIVCKNNTSSI